MERQWEPQSNTRLLRWLLDYFASRPAALWLLRASSVWGLCWQGDTGGRSAAFNAILADQRCGVVKQARCTLQGDAGAAAAAEPQGEPLKPVKFKPRYASTSLQEELTPGRYWTH